MCSTASEFKMNHKFVKRQTFRFSPAIHYNYEYKLLTLVYYLGYEHKVACMTHLHDSNPILGTFLSKESTDVSKAPMRITLLKKIICSCFIRDLELKRSD